MDQTERNIEIIKERIEAQAAELRKELAVWIDQHAVPVPEGHPMTDSQFRGPYAAITAAMLETAVDRMLALHGGPDAREFLLDVFERRLSAYKRSLQ